MKHVLNTREVRRVALWSAGLLGASELGLPTRAARGAQGWRDAAERWIEHFGYLQLDTVSVSGARTHGLVLASRMAGFDAAEHGEALLSPGRPLFEYWGHEACWMPLSMYPWFGYRRERFRTHPWWGDIIGEHPELAAQVLQRLRDDGPLRSSELEGGGAGEGYWSVPLARRVLQALWSSGEVAVRERVGFHRVWDVAERVIPDEVRGVTRSFDEALPELLATALRGHGWASTSTLRATWRLRHCGREVEAALRRLRDEGRVVPCGWRDDDGRVHGGWVHPDILERVDSLSRKRPRRDVGVLLSPFDPVLWDRDRVQALFGFEQRIEIYVPPKKRRWGYYCLPVLAGEHLVARVDLKAERAAGVVRLVSRHMEPRWERDAAAARAVDTALERHAAAVGLRLERAPA